MIAKLQQTSKPAQTFWPFFLLKLSGLFIKQARSTIITNNNLSIKMVLARISTDKANGHHNMVWWSTLTWKWSNTSITIILIVITATRSAPWFSLSPQNHNHIHYQHCHHNHDHHNHYHRSFAESASYH